MDESITFDRVRSHAATHDSAAFTATEHVRILREQAQKIFGGFSLSPGDRAEAIKRFVRMALTSEDPLRPKLSPGELTYNVLYSMECEHVLEHPD